MTAMEIFDVFMRQRQEITSLRRNKATLRKEHEITSLRRQMERVQDKEREITSLRRQMDRVQAKEREALAIAHKWKDKAVGLQKYTLMLIVLYFRYLLFVIIGSSSLSSSFSLSMLWGFTNNRIKKTPKHENMKKKRTNH